jgi:hypothetical protein
MAMQLVGCWAQFWLGIWSFNQKEIGFLMDLMHGSTT